VDDILVVTFTGESTGTNAQAMIRRYFEIVLGSGKRKVLADIRLLKGRLSGANTYFLVRNLPVKPVPADIRTAIVESRGNRVYADFLETTAANAGGNCSTTGRARWPRKCKVRCIRSVGLTRTDS